MGSGGYRSGHPRNRRFEATDPVHVTFAGRRTGRAARARTPACGSVSQDRVSPPRWPTAIGIVARSCGEPHERAIDVSCSGSAGRCAAAGVASARAGCPCRCSGAQVLRCSCAAGRRAGCWPAGAGGRQGGRRPSRPAGPGRPPRRPGAGRSGRWTAPVPKGGSRRRRVPRVGGCRWSYPQSGPCACGRTPQGRPRTGGRRGQDDTVAGLPAGPRSGARRVGRQEVRGVPRLPERVDCAVPWGIRGFRS